MRLVLWADTDSEVDYFRDGRVKGDLYLIAAWPGRERASISE